MALVTTELPRYFEEKSLLPKELPRLVSNDSATGLVTKTSTVPAWTILHDGVDDKVLKMKRRNRRLMERHFEFDCIGDIEVDIDRVVTGGRRWELTVD